MEDAREWLNQWFREIRPWNPKDVDVDRIVWLRVFGIPAHAWNDNFFALVSKPWGFFMNTDDATSKNLTMDVARILIRTSCQKVVDEFIDVKINAEIFHLRVVEDSYGPMRLMIPQPQGQNGRVVSEDEDEEEEEERRLLAAEEEWERESEGEGENLMALNFFVNAINSPPIVSNQVVGGMCLDVGVSMVDRMCVNGSKGLGQEEGAGGPSLSIIPHKSVMG
ncbi:DUF4283 domain protein, partial [Trifolium medium]|nr:DUF4283 domain protein [Trifolium medium]